MSDDKMMRDMFAAQAISGLIGVIDFRRATEIATAAFSIADAMMEERAVRDMKRDQFGRVIR